MGNLSSEKDKAQKKLFKLKEFYFFLLGPLFLAAAAGIFIVYNTNFIFDLTYEGFNNFIVFFRVPLGIAAFVFPSVALVASNHRSRQAAEQIRTQTEQNIFANHYTHMEKFEEYCKRLESFNAGFLKNENPRTYHKVIFPSSREGRYSVNEEFLNEAAEYSIELSALATKIVGNQISRMLSPKDIEGIELDKFIEKAFRFLFFLNTNLHIPGVNPIHELGDLTKDVWIISELLDNVALFDGMSPYRFGSNSLSKFHDFIRDGINLGIIPVEKQKKKYWTK